jgi:hypothetical protein
MLPGSLKAQQLDTPESDPILSDQTTPDLDTEVQLTGSESASESWSEAGEGAGETGSDGNNAVSNSETDGINKTDDLTDAEGSSLAPAASGPAGSEAAGTASDEPIDGLSDELITIAATAQQISPRSLEVYEAEAANFDQLKDLLVNSANNSISIIYLTGNITFPSTTYTCSPNRADFTIVGHPKGDNSVRYAIQDYPGSYFYAGADGRNITLQDLDLRGYNYYGTFCVDPYANNIYKVINVNYIGSQLICNIDGNTIIQDSNITIGTIPSNPNWTAPAVAQNPQQEVAETMSLEFDGNCNIVSTAPDMPTFNFYGIPQSKITVGAGANISIDTSASTSGYGLFYMQAPGLNYPAFTIGDNASFVVNCRSLTSVDGHRLDTLILGKSATFSLNQTQNRFDLPTLPVRGSIVIGTDSIFEVMRPANTYVHPLIDLLLNGATVTFNNPRRVFLNNPHGGIFGNYSNSTYTVNISGSTEAINVWSTSNNNATDSPDNLPTNYWNRENAGVMKFSSTISGSGTAAASISNLTSDDFASAVFNASSFSNQTTAILTMGSYELGIDDVTEYSTAIAGLADSLADVIVTYTNTGTARKLITQATAGGSYSVDIPDTWNVDHYLPLGMLITVRGYTNHLHFWQKTTVKEPEDPGSLSLETPMTLDFGSAEIVADPILIQRVQDPLTVTVFDTRPLFLHTAWSLAVAIDGPLSAVDGSGVHILQDALVYVDADSQMVPLSQASLPLYQATTDSSNKTMISWPEGQGIMLYVLPGQALANTPYNATIQWLLSDAP